MRTPYRSSLRFRPSLPWILLCMLMTALWVAGGASRSDASGQVVVRAASFGCVIIAILFSGAPSLDRGRPVLYFLIASVLLTLLQLIPLPPGIWQALPGRTVLADAATVSGQAQPWRPWSMVPGATANAAGSLIVPAATLLLVTSLKEAERSWLPGLLLCLVLASTLLGLLQFSGSGFDNPFINDMPGQVSGSFANRNHLALFLAIGCVLVPPWVFMDGRRSQWRAPIGFGLVLLFLLTILAGGSRAGIILGVLALGAGLLLAREGIRKELNRYPRWVFPALIATLIGVIAMFVLISVAADRAVSITRVFADDPGQDLRTRGLPTLFSMFGTYFPFGSGLGGFDPVFRIHEPLALLSFTYFNHAHNDLLEVGLDAGLPGLLLLLSALLWWASASVRVWRASSDTRKMLPGLGSTILLLVVLASAFDYPARTPMIMAVVIMAGMWLSGGLEERGGSALPKTGRHL